MWLFCSECGSNLPSERARCPVCGRQPSPEERPGKRSRLGPLLALAVLIGVGAVTTLAVVNPPLVTSWVDAAASRLG